MNIAPALLEGWMRDYYFSTEVDVGSSGVQPFSFEELRELTGIEHKNLDRLTFHDSETLGALNLRKVIAQRWCRQDFNQVMVTHGSSEAIFLIMNTILCAGDEVIVLDPCYQQLFSIAESIGCELKQWHLRFENQYVPDFDELKRLITNKTKMVVVNFPHNPTGASLTQDQQSMLLASVAEVGAYLVWDAAFAELIYDNDVPLPDPNLEYERVISIGTLSKAYGLPGLRVGWCLANPDILARFAHLRDYISLHLSPLVEYIAQKAIENSDRLISLRRQQAYNNLQYLTDWINHHQEAVDWVKPRGGVCAFPRFPSIKDIEEFCRDLAHLHKVLLVPGTCFGQQHHVRLGFGGEEHEFKEGLKRIEYLLDPTHDRSYSHAFL